MYKCMIDFILTILFMITGADKFFYFGIINNNVNHVCCYGSINTNPWK